MDHAQRTAGLPDRKLPSAAVTGIVALGCAVPGLLSVLQQVVQAHLDQEALDWRYLAFGALDWLLLALLTPLIVRMVQHSPLDRSALTRTLAAHGVGILLLCLAWATLGLALGWLLHSFPAQGPLDRAYLRWILITLPWSAVVYCTLSGGIYALDYYLRARAEEDRAARLDAKLAEARLAALRNQINPHFLFNCLNAVTVLVRGEERKRAIELIDLLADTLRRLLRPDAPQEVPLEDELVLVRQYLQIEKIRFSDRLFVTWHIREDARQMLVPSMILQPIVENAVKHGVAARRTAGRIGIAAELDAGTLLVTVSDDGPGFTIAEGHEGIGLGNVRARLQTLYSDRAGVEVLSPPEGGAVVRLRLPERRAMI